MDDWFEPILNIYISFSHSHFNFFSCSPSNQLKKNNGGAFVPSFPPLTPAMLCLCQEAVFGNLNAPKIGQAAIVNKGKN